MGATPAVGARGDDAFARGHAAKDDIEEAAEGEPEERGKDGTEDGFELGDIESFGHGGLPYLNTIHRRRTVVREQWLMASMQDSLLLGWDGEFPGRGRIGI